MKYIAILPALFMLSACGTVTTLTHNDSEISGKLQHRKTYCESIPRVYSGVSYDFCSLHSNPNTVFVDAFVAFYLFDMAASAVADTAVLPYSIYAQAKNSHVDIQ